MAGAETPATAGRKRRVRRGLCACGHIQLFQKMVDVVLDRRFGDVERLGDFLVRLPLAETVEHLPLAARQRLSVAGRPLTAVRDPAKQLCRNSGRADEFRARDALDRHHEIVDGRFGGDVPGSPRLGTFDDVRRDFIHGERQNLAPRRVGPKITNQFETLSRRHVDDDDVRAEFQDAFAGVGAVGARADDREAWTVREASSEAVAIETYFGDDEDARPGRTR